MARREPALPSGLRTRSLRDLLYVLFGHKKKMIAFVVLLFGVVAVKTLLRQGAYRSEARLLLRPGRESVNLDPTATIGEIAQIQRSHDWEINSEIEILKSREIAERVVADMGVDLFERASGVTPSGGAATAGPPVRRTAPRSGPEVLQTIRSTLALVRAGPARLAACLGLSEPLSRREKAIRRIGQSVSVKALTNTSVISLSCEEQHPELARNILDSFIQAYLEKHLSVFYVDSSQQFFEQQVSESRTKLREAEKELQDLKNATGVSSLEEQRTAVIDAIGLLERNLAGAQADLVAANAKVAGIQKMLSDLPETIVVEEISGLSDYGTDLMRSKLYELRLALKDLEAKYTRDSRQMANLREQVHEGTNLLEKEQSKPIRTETKKGVNMAYLQMQTSMLTESSNAAGLQSKIEKLRAQIEEAQNALKSINETEVRISRLQKEVALLTDSYSRYFQKLEEARIDQALKKERISSISLVQAATLPVSPSGPGKVVRLGLGLVLALVGGVGFAFLCEYLDHSLKTPEDVQERLELPALASIPRVRLHTVCPVSKSYRWRRLGAERGQAATLQWEIPANVRRHYAAFREQFFLRTNGALHDHYVIGVTSCAAREGVSTVAANLASTLSEQNKGTVLLVDANVHDPSVHRIFRTKLSPGLLDALAADRDDHSDEAVIHRTGNLSFLTAGRLDGGPFTGVMSEDFNRLIQAARQDYRFVVVDLPALEEEGAPIRLAGSCDGVILVVEAQRLRWEVVAQAKQQLQQWNVRVPGVLLNKRRFPVPNWVYAAL
jgi:uncharacterized protein involved in exopolysaccharide biosynthesis/Mrp family chromosome partitioning ATPase